MEESSEAHMETDVSSTTEDVSEAQEVTGSNGNVEMIVIVEKVSEEEDNSSQDSDLQLPVATSVEASSITLSPPKCPPKPMQQVSKSPSKGNEALKSPDKLKTTQSPTKETQSSNVQAKTLLPDQSEDIVDSSSKGEAQVQHPEKSTVKSISPTKSNMVNPEPQKSTCSSPPKEQPQEATKLTIYKEKQSLYVVKMTSSEEPMSAKSSINGQLEVTKKSKVDDAKNISQTEIDMEKEVTNESQADVDCESLEKEHNKSISRELKSLINSAKESKIISECTQLTSKTRKSRTPLDASNTSLNISVEADKIHDIRRSSVNSQKSNCSEKSDKTTVKRSMRSQNPEFVNKVKQFLNSVTSKVQKESDEGTDEEIEVTKSKDLKFYQLPSSPKKKRVAENFVQDNTSKLRSDPYCWRCHWAVELAPNEKAHPPMACTVCPRSYHYKCLSGVERSKINSEKSWVCPECMSVLHAESSETRSPAMKKITLGRLCELLKHALERMMDLNGVEPFMQPVDRTLFPDYEKYVVHPMDLTLMKDNITTGHYGSTEAFVADVQWILHNSIIFNTLQSKLTAAARTLVRSCRAEMGEIEACPECYAAAHARRPTWFTDVCSTPHMLLWAKLKGFPYWPAKGMSVNNSGLVDVRFFGAHDRAWVPAKDCFLYSEKDPNNFRTKRQDILDSMQEAEQHIRNISRKYGKFVYPPFKTQFDPAKLNEQLKLMIPSFEGDIRPPVKEKPVIASPNMVKLKCRSNSKSSKSSHNDGDVSESEDTAVTSRKMADGAEIAMEEEELTGEKDKTMDTDTPAPQPKEETSRKRRRSEMEEATITILDSASKEKKKRVEAVDDKADVLRQYAVVSKNKVEKDASTPNDNVLKSKDNEPSSSTPEKDKDQQIPRLTPIKLVISTRANKSVVINKTNNFKIKGRVTPIKLKQMKLDRSLLIEKDKSTDKDVDKSKSHKRRNSKSNKSLYSSNPLNTTKTEKTDKKCERRNSSKDKGKETDAAKSKEDPNKSLLDILARKLSDSPKSAKERLKFDDDTSLAVLARESKTSNISGMPTISSVRSLSTTAQNTNTTNAKTSTTPKSVEVSIDGNSDCSIFVPTSTDNVRSMNEAVNKLQRLRNNNEQTTTVSKVAVRAFARMTSPEPQKKKENVNKDMVVEIKAEPIDLDDADRQMEKIDMMSAFRLQPVNPMPNLRDVRINKVMTSTIAQKGIASKPVEARPRARKTFPQPKKVDDGRSELISKNSMVYIPIQPPVTPGPVRGTRLTPVSVSNGPGCSLVRLTTTTAAVSTCNNASINSAVNTVTTPLTLPKPTNSSQAPPLSCLSPASVPASAPASVPASASGPLSLVSSVGQIPTTVHTVPLITSVNGQWTFSLQPIMSVGGLDDDIPPLLNGLPDRGNAPASLLPMLPNQMMTPSNPLLVPASATIMQSTILPPTTIGPVAQTSLCAQNIAPVSSVSCGPSVASMASVLPMPSVVSVPSVASLPNIASMQSSVAPSFVPATFTANRSVDTTTPAELPRLQQRPSLVNPLDVQAAVGTLPAPSTAGPLTAKLNQNAVKLMDFFRSLLEDSLEKLDEPVATATALKLQMEQMRWRHRQEIDELKHNHELTLAEMRSSMEKEKARLVGEVRQAAQADLDAAVKAAKAKQWCANCNQEAQFYCCWNTSYCDYPCQRAHWSQHFAVCTQQRSQDGENSGDALSSPPESRLQPQPDNIPKNSPALGATPALTVGGKLAPRPPAHDKPSSLIINMEKDTSGNQTLKCVGTYKPPAQPAAVLNKQVINEETAKKVVTSGGYLIVGASNSTSMVTPPRRTHTIQYYT